MRCVYEAGPKMKMTTPVAREAIKKLLGLFSIVGVDGEDLQCALTLPIDDMEDALQAWCATAIWYNIYYINCYFTAILLAFRCCA